MGRKRYYPIQRRKKRYEVINKEIKLIIVERTASGYRLNELAEQLRLEKAVIIACLAEPWAQEYLVKLRKLRQLFTLQNLAIMGMMRNIKALDSYQESK